MDTPQLPLEPPEAGDSPKGTVDATVVRSLFSNEENGWSAVRCRSEREGSFIAVGTLLGARAGDELRLTGRWIEHPRFGSQFEVASWVHLTPSTLDGVRSFLGSGRIRGIGPKMAERIVAAFGLDTLEIIENEPDRLLEVRGVGEKTLRSAKDSWAKHRGIQRIMVFLTGHGVTPGVAVKAHSRYGARALDVVRENPYRLADEVFGVGFRTADRIGHNIGIADDAPQRLEAGLLYLLQQATKDGHVFLPENDLTAAASELLGVEADPVALALKRLEVQQRVVIHDRGRLEAAVYSKRLEEAEASVVNRLLAILDAADRGADFDVSRAIQWYQDRHTIELAQAQRKALAAALAAEIVIITGGPGTGKTTLIRGVTKILSKRGRKVLLAAPTGRAAKRLQEATGHDARTIHRLLEFNPRTASFTRNQDKPIDAEVLVLDEVSMLDVELAGNLLRAVPDGCRLVMVGDADQLPSVGPGNVLADLIASGVVAVIRLDEIFRQAERSLIVVNAHRINHGEMPYLKTRDDESDFYFVNRDDPAEAADLAIDFATRRIPRRFRLDPINDIQLLSPMHRGEMGVARLNDRLQAALTPPGPELVIGLRRFRVGDKVMQIRNNYELDIYNGDIGRITGLDTEERELVVSFDGKPVLVDAANLEDLVPAFACTIHKAQGSEYPAVVVLLHHSHHIMLQRNLLYTAVTRGKRLVVIVGSRRALGRAVGNATVRERHTMLAQRLRKARPS